MIMFDKILEYQKIEGNVLKLEGELAKSADREKAAEIQQELKSFHARLVVLENNAKQVNDAYSKAIKKYQEYNEKLAELEKQVESIDESKVDLYEKAYKDFANIAVGLEKEIAKMHNEIQQISHEYEEIIKKSKVDREKFDKYKAAYTKLKLELEPKINEGRAELAKIQKEIEAKLFQKYLQKRENRIFPVFVALTDNKCGGCRMEISASKLGAMKNNEFGVIECENCGRIIYNK